MPPSSRAVLVALLAAVACGNGSSPSGGAAPPADAATDASLEANAPESGAGADAAVDASTDAHGSSGDGGAVDAPHGDAPSPDAGPPPDLGPGGDFRAYADAAAAALQSLYDPTTGLFPTTGWWNSANALTALIDYSARTKTSTYVGDITTTFDKNGAQSFLNNFYDDEGWWALAWIDAYDLTHDGRYLTMAQTIFADMAGGWDTTCNGGIWWSKDRTYKNAIANELFFQVAIRLHTRAPDDGGTGGYLDWATREWKWFDASGMMSGTSLVNDGLDASCKNNGQTAWTYNQGVVIGALVDLAHVTSDATLLARAQAIGDASIAKLVDARGVLREPCEPSCGGDGPQFKGIFMRHLAELAAATGAPRYEAFLATNADWIWNAARGGSGSQLGLTWSGPFDSADAARQSSALDALNAAIPYTDPQANQALFKAATANGSCGAGQAAAQAFDGTVTTKWCAGATAGAYWLSVDLGQATSVSRFIARHAGAGGESQAWNTKDFTLSASTDGTTWSPLVAVTGNTLPVTIHRAAAAPARYVKLDITAPQTDPSTIAARVDELEVYAR
jgi:predicted alpha-1,6-mannanase (GH76 family)